MISLAKITDRKKKEINNKLRRSTKTRVAKPGGSVATMGKRNFFRYSCLYNLRMNFIHSGRKYLCHGLHNRQFHVDIMAAITITILFGNTQVFSLLIFWIAGNFKGRPARVFMPASGYEHQPTGKGTDSWTMQKCANIIYFLNDCIIF